MGRRDDWYRRRSWTLEDQEDFEIRLTRARPASRPQYLRIQALHLSETGDPALLPAALQLADRALADHPDDVLGAWVHTLRARCFERLRQPLQAIQSYRAALQEERKRPNVVSGASIGFASVAVRFGLTSLYAEAEALLEEFPPSLMFPADRYLYHAVRAIVAADGGYLGKAQAEAILALEAAAATHSGFRYHPQAGLVDDSTDQLRLRLTALAAG